MMTTNPFGTPRASRETFPELFLDSEHIHVFPWSKHVPPGAILQVKFREYLVGRELIKQGVHRHANEETRVDERATNSGADVERASSIGGDI